MKVVRNTCRRELGEMKSVNAVKTTTKSAFENFQRQLLFTEIYLKYLEKKKKKKQFIYSSWRCYIAFSSTNLLRNQKLVINIQFT